MFYQNYKKNTTIFHRKLFSVRKIEKVNLREVRVRYFVNKSSCYSQFYDLSHRLQDYQESVVT